MEKENITEINEKEEKEYEYLAKIYIKADKRQRISRNELEKFFDIAHNHGWRCARRIFEND